MTTASMAQEDKLISDLRSGIADAEDVLRLTADQTGDEATTLRKRVQARLIRAKTELGRLQEAALAKAKVAGRAADEYVHENPWKSIGIAAGVGLVVGLLISRR